MSYQEGGQRLDNLRFMKINYPAMQRAVQDLVADLMRICNDPELLAYAGSNINGKTSDPLSTAMGSLTRLDNFAKTQPTTLLKALTKPPNMLA